MIDRDNFTIAINISSTNCKRVMLFTLVVIWPIIAFTAFTVKWCNNSGYFSWLAVKLLFFNLILKWIKVTISVSNEYLRRKVVKSRSKLYYITDFFPQYYCCPATNTNTIAVILIRLCITLVLLCLIACYFSCYLKCLKK